MIYRQAVLNRLDNAVNDACAGHQLTMPARVRRWTATFIPMDSVTLLQLTAPPTTPAAAVSPSSRRHTPTPHASTSEATTTTVVAIIIIPTVMVTTTTVNVITEGCTRRPFRIVGDEVESMFVVPVILVIAITMSFIRAGAEQVKRSVTFQLHLSNGIYFMRTLRFCKALLITIIIYDSCC